MSQLTIFDIEEQIKKHKQELKQLEDKLVAAKLESPDRRLAKELHSMLCTWNHTDCCSWFYEMKDGEDQWTGYAHGSYLKKAQTLIHICEKDNLAVERAIEIFKIIKEI